MRRPWWGANTRCCSADDSRAYSGSTSVSARSSARKASDGVADLALARQEHEHVAGGLAPQLAHRVGDGADLVGRVGHRSVAHLHRVGAAGDLDDRRRPRRGGEVGGEALGLDGGRGDDDLEVGAPGQQLGQVAEDEVDVEAPLVGLVDDDRVVGREPAVAAQLGQQDAVGHELHQRGVPHPVGEAHGVPDRLAQLDAELLGDAVGHRARRQPPGLGVADHGVDAAAQLQADLGQLGGLARSRLAGHHHHLVLGDGLGDLLAALRDGQLLGIRDGGQAQAAPGAALVGVVRPLLALPRPGHGGRGYGVRSVDGTRRRLRQPNPKMSAPRANRVGCGPVPRVMRGRPAPITPRWAGAQGSVPAWCAPRRSGPSPTPSRPRPRRPRRGCGPRSSTT